MKPQSIGLPYDLKTLRNIVARSDPKRNPTDQEFWEGVTVSAFLDKQERLRVDADKWGKSIAGRRERDKQQALTIARSLAPALADDLYADNSTIKQTAAWAELAKRLSPRIQHLERYAKGVSGDTIRKEWFPDVSSPADFVRDQIVPPAALEAVEALVQQVLEDAGDNDYSAEELERIVFEWIAEPDADLNECTAAFASDLNDALAGQSLPAPIVRREILRQMADWETVPQG